ncbi:IPT/TIG domain-containing protein [Fulvivirga ligni]|uniref:IPT/TIG domain-containing protein n=1 Tax=Fulvivirga ligni TaxID=2904246 RepID=UPI001F1AB4D7|nr:IPT/TIG domain-containing protein [Fulvivirga ligni]UII23704.1 IPT/TIG domain-containing protein [Fulvivirga ligni]
MKFINRLYILFVLFTIMGLASCGDDDDNNTPDNIMLLSFGPTGVQHGEMIKFIGENLDRVESVELGGGVVIEKASFDSQTDQVIELVVPAQAEAGVVTLHSAEGDVVSKTVLSFEVPVVITAFTGEVKPGNNITITGNFLNWVESVWFTRDVEVTDFVSQSMTELVIKLPMEAETGPIVFMTGGTEPLVIETEEDLIVTMPVISSLSPLSLQHIDELTISGTDLDLVKEIRFPDGSTMSEFSSQSETEIKLNIPATVTDGNIVLVLASGVEVSSDDAISIILPITTSITPENAELGDDVTITGSNLDLVKSITFKGSAAVITEFVSQSASEIVVTVPDDAKNGTLTYKTIHDFEVVSEVEASLNVSAVYFIYDDALNANWQQWGGWGTDLQDMANTEQPEAGSNALKIIYNDAYGAVQLHPLATDAGVLNNFSKLVLSVYGGASSDGNTMAIQLKDGDGNSSSEPTFTVAAGVYTEITINLSAFTGVDLTNIVEFYIKNYGVASNTVYIDNIQLK